jgi:hypothetical protein
MNAKNLLRIALLAFVAVAVVMMVRRELNDGGSAEPALVKIEPLPADGLVVYYFHADIRCPTCQKIEQYAHEALDARLGEELASGKVTWRTLNYEATENAHFATEYEIAAPTVVLVRRHDGRDGEWRNLTRVWELVGDKPSFVDYVAAEASSLLAAK